MWFLRISGLAAWWVQLVGLSGWLLRITGFTAFLSQHVRPSGRLLHVTGLAALPVQGSSDEGAHLLSPVRGSSPTCCFSGGPWATGCAEEWGYEEEEEEDEGVKFLLSTGRFSGGQC